jgi:ElaB/YqjD/DUF883 family membrane-anchored ribosome-binding protein
VCVCEFSSREKKDQNLLNLQSKAKEYGMTTETQAARDKLVEDFKAVIHDAEELLKATSDQTGDKIGAVRARAEASLREARRKLGDMESNIVGRTKAAAKATDQLVHENPWQSVALATAVGFLLGMLTSRH